MVTEMDHRKVLETIARLTFPGRSTLPITGSPGSPTPSLSIRCADYVERRDDILTVDWLVDLANIEEAGPNAIVGSSRYTVPVTSGQSIQPTQSAQITMRPQRDEFTCERIIIANAGTPGGAADWIVNDIRINNRSQFVGSGDIPGDLFAVNAIDSFVSFEKAMPSTDIVVIVTYIGINEPGCPFNASMVGSAANDPLPQYVRVRTTNAKIPPGFAWVSKLGNKEPSITISIPTIDAALVDVAVDAALTSGRTPAVDTVIAQATEGAGIIHEAYVAFVMQRADELRAGEASS
jgi:hypothetical protein